MSSQAEGDITGSGGENPGSLTYQLARHLPERFESIISRFRMPEDSELVSGFQDGTEKVEFSANEVEAVEALAEPGTFLLHLKQEVGEHKATTMVVTGATLLACAAAIRLQRKNK